MKTVKLTSFDEKKGEFTEVATISYDGKKLVGSGDPQVYNYVLGVPIRVPVGQELRELTTATPLEFLRGLEWQYRSVYLSAGPLLES